MCCSHAVSREPPYDGTVGAGDVSMMKEHPREIQRKLRVLQHAEHPLDQPLAQRDTILIIYLM